MEKLIRAAIVRDGTTHSGFKSHYQIRHALGDPNPTTSNLNDQEGFLTSKQRFVDRNEAQKIALAAGQLSRPMGRKLLSSDLNW